MLYLPFANHPNPTPCHAARKRPQICTNSTFNLRGVPGVAPAQSDGAMLPVLYPTHRTLSKIQRIGFAGMKSLCAMLAHAF